MRPGDGGSLVRYSARGRGIVIVRKKSLLLMVVMVIVQEWVPLSHLGSWLEGKEVRSGDSSHAVSRRKKDGRVSQKEQEKECMHYCIQASIG